MSVNSGNQGDYASMPFQKNLSGSLKIYCIPGNLRCN